MIDLRSDTVTRPTPAMRRAMAGADVGDDVLDGDPTVQRLESEVAALLGKERSLFFPTGSMANQAAIWVQTTPGTEILIDADAHIVQWEISAAAALCGVQVRPLRGTSPVFGASDLAAAIRPSSVHASDAALVCIENTHNGAGGMVTSLAEMRAMREVASRASLPVHLDGARLWNAAVALGATPADVAADADTVMVSFTKGLGAPVGAALAGPAPLITAAHRVRKILGGGMRQSGILAAGVLHALAHHGARLGDDHAAASALARSVDGAGGARVVPPDTNIVMIDLPHPVADDVVDRAEALGVRVTAWSTTRVRAVTHLDAPMPLVADAAPRLRQALEEVLEKTARARA